MSAGPYPRAVLRRVWAGLVIVGCAAAILSFDALADLGVLIGMHGRVEIGPARLYLAWLLPLSIDVFAVVATYIWLRQIGGPATVHYAMCCALTAIGATILGNGYHGYIVATDDPIPWGAAVLIYSVPPVALGGLVHLGMLVGRDVEAALDEPPPDAARPVEPEWRTAYRLGLDDALAAEWTLALARWAPVEAEAGGDEAEPGGWPPPDRAEPDDVLAADLRAVSAARRAGGLDPLSRDGVVERYSVGKSRASRLRELAERAEPGGEVGEPGGSPDLIARVAYSDGPGPTVRAGAGEQLDAAAGGTGRDRAEVGGRG